MANKPAMVGVLQPSGEMLHDVWNPGDTLTDPDGAPIGGSGVNPPGLPASGDITYYDGLGWARLGIGGTDEVLTVAGGLPTWAAGGGGGGGKEFAPRFVVGIAPDTADDCDFLHVNGVTDGITLAINAANAAGGGTVYLRNGVYQALGPTIYNLGDYVNIIGESYNGTKIVFTDPSVANSLITLSGNYQIIENISIVVPDNCANQIYAISLDYGDESIIRNVYFDTPGAAGSMVALIGSTYTYGALIKNCRNESGSKVRLLYMDGPYNVTVKDCIFYAGTALTDALVWLIEPEGLVIENCLFNHSAQTSGTGMIYVSNANQFELGRLEIRNCTMEGYIRAIFVGTTNIGNTVYYSFRNNNFEMRDYAGSLGGSVIEFRHTGGGSASDCDISNNIFRFTSDQSGAAVYGVQLGAGTRNFNVSGNVIYGNDRRFVSAIHVEAEDCVIANNNIYGVSTAAGQNGIFVDASSGKGSSVVGNKVSLTASIDSKGIYVNDALKGYAVKGNTVLMGTGNGNTGIRGDNIENSVVSGNAIEVYGGAGVSNPHGIAVYTGNCVVINGNSVIIGNAAATGISDPSPAFLTNSVASGNKVDNTGGGTKYVLSGGVYIQAVAPTNYLND